MIYLFTDTPNQIVFLSLDEARQYYATAFTDYLLVLTHEENSTTGNDLAQVVNVMSETVRVTQFTMTTVGLTLAGRYRYEVYGQNSSTNTDPTNHAVVGLCQRGYAVLTANTTWFDIPTGIIPNDIIYEP
jgi:hypothetical protein